MFLILHQRMKIQKQEEPAVAWLGFACLWASSVLSFSETRNPAHHKAATRPAILPYQYHSSDEVRAQKVFKEYTCCTTYAFK